MTRFFSREEQRLLAEAVHVSEELVNNHYKMSSGGWLKNRYDIVTAKDLKSHERIDGPVAQVVKYEVRRKDVPLGSSSFSLYRICLQDGTILSTARRARLDLYPFLMYILCHELVHVVRFSKYQHRYESASEANATREEESRVHRITFDILQGNILPGMDQVFDFYRDWIDTTGGGAAVKNLEKLS